MTRLTRSYRVSARQEGCPAGRTEGGRSDVLRQPQPLLNQHVDVGGPADTTTQRITTQLGSSSGKIRFSRVLKR
jgi:hypothetical protein